MLFNSAQFILLFMPAVLLCTFVLRWLRPGWLIGSLALFSFCFYIAGDLHHVWVLLLSTAYNFWVGQRIGRSEPGERARRRWLGVGIFGNLVLLGVYKYANFVLEGVSYLVGVEAPRLPLGFPLGISFFTFTQIAYLVDVSRGHPAERSASAYALFVWYFPHQIAGPILHHKEMLSQFRSRELGVRSVRLAVGLSIFALALFKKVIAADYFAGLASPVFRVSEQGESLQFFEAWAGALAYSLQLYFDFSAYCDMAIGVSFMLGVRLPINFDSPYKAASIVDFWRRWHITLSRFLRDYLYISLGGNRKGAARRYLNLLITMILGGLWHGAGFTFVIWGALHGFYLVVNHLWSGLWGERASTHVTRAASWALTMFCVVIGWTFFRATSVASALAMLRGMAGLNGIAVPDSLSPATRSAPGLFHLSPGWLGNAGGGTLPYSLVVATLLLGWLWCVSAPNIQEVFWEYEPALLYDRQVARPALGWSPSLAWYALCAIFGGLALSRVGLSSEFLYFNF